MAKRAREDAEEVEIRSRAELRDWLSDHHARDEGVWLVHHKKVSPHYVPMGEIVAECLCFGWVDSVTRGKDETRTMHWIAPRNPESSWSAVNKALVERLEEAGLMTDAGRRLIDAARGNGAWSRLDAVERLEVPDDLASAFAARPGARETWETFPRSVRRGVLEWIVTAKRPETRAARIAETADDSAAGERPHQWRR